MRRIVIVAVLASATAAARAEPPGLTPPTITFDKPEKSETTATVLSVVGVAVPLAVIGAGLALDKATNSDPRAEDNEPMGITLVALGGIALIPGSVPGRGYTNHVPWLNMGVRLLALSATISGALEIGDARRCQRGEVANESCSDVSLNDGYTMLGLGLATYVGSTIYDIIAARREVREWNRARRATVVPTLSRDSAGLAIQLPL